MRNYKTGVLLLATIICCAPLFAQTFGEQLIVAPSGGGGTGTTQTVADSNVTGNDTGPGVFQLNYFANRNNGAGADQFVRVINSGTNGAPLDTNQGIVCANIYVFDHQQQMLECCSCPLTANDLLTLSLNNHLLNDPLTGFPAQNDGVIKIVSDYKSKCSADSLTSPKSQLLAFSTHIQQPVTGNFVTTESAFTPGALSYQERDFLGLACSFVRFLGSGKGRCDCGPPDFKH